jgi:class 3 adenylate cyclase
MMAGQRVYAIFGFCDIRSFTESTEVLQTKIMLFVNQIAEITHSMVDKYGGSANKNIGDAFLLVWKYKHEEEFF